MPRKKADAAAAPAPAEEKTAKKPAKKEPALPILKKAAAKKEKPARVEEVYLQAGGAEWNVSGCKDRVIEAYKAEGHREASIKKLVIYLKPEEGKAYYVVNDGVNGCIDL